MTVAVHTDINEIKTALFSPLSIVSIVFNHVPAVRGSDCPMVRLSVAVHHVMVLGIRQ